MAWRERPPVDPEELARVQAALLASHLAIEARNRANLARRPAPKLSLWERFKEWVLRAASRLSRRPA
jgi:hypothetical protein